MLFVKNLLFLDGSLATLAPDLDLFAEVQRDRGLFHHAATASASPHDIGIDPRAHTPIDMNGVRAAVGVGDDVESPHLPRPAGPARADPPAHGGAPPAGGAPGAPAGAGSPSADPRRPPAG